MEKNKIDEFLNNNKELFDKPPDTFGPVTNVSMDIK